MANRRSRATRPPPSWVLWTAGAPPWRGRPAGWRSAAEDTPEQLHTPWREAVARSRATVAEALADAGPEQLARGDWPAGQVPSLRRILVDLIEEYARHVGHADLIRESVDGLVGEDPPR
ncbi:DUF664 domain-containing protein [Micromonospora sp. CPCC 205539]|uniref:mycothiol transferase n=1 Tax=Micromonospora sp. CPCC 205539 TaxID=3122408 RepID=UPI002FEF3C01